MPFSIDDINRIAAQVVPEPPGLIYYVPEPWALPRACFANAWRKVELSGGRHRYGWTFHLKVRPGMGEYLFLTHHAVWNHQDGRLIDVTPFQEDTLHHPLMIDGSILFLVDNSAEPIIRGEVISPLPLRYFALGNDAEINRYVSELNEKEKAELTALIELLGKNSP
jgi:hypothetical protein